MAPCQSHDTILQPSLLPTSECCMLYICAVNCFSNPFSVACYVCESCTASAPICSASSMQRFSGQSQTQSLFPQGSEAFSLPLAPLMTLNHMVVLQVFKGRHSIKTGNLRPEQNQCSVKHAHQTQIAVRADSSSDASQQEVLWADAVGIVEREEQHAKVDGCVQGAMAHAPDTMEDLAATELSDVQATSNQ